MTDFFPTPIDLSPTVLRADRARLADCWARAGCRQPDAPTPPPKQPAFADVALAMGREAAARSGRRGGQARAQQAWEGQRKRADDNLVDDGLSKARNGQPGATTGKPACPEVRPVAMTPAVAEVLQAIEAAPVIREGRREVNRRNAGAVPVERYVEWGRQGGLISGARRRARKAGEE